MNARRYNGCEDNMVEGGETASVTIVSLIADLTNDDGVVRVKARSSLVLSGDKAVEPLIEALAAPNQWVRWEAAKALGQIGNPAATNALVKALEDKMFDVRWLAAQALINIGTEAIMPVLKALIERADSTWMREGAHHVLHDLAQGELKEVLRPVLAALEDVDSSVEVPLVAKTALRSYTESRASP
ncbi:MAG: HEAT repeat domain-containing protein [Dehalococcoidia bacterium]|nr:HEAT repeat domain-containing protein [Dehalococcoidia bacterium]